MAGAVDVAEAQIQEGAEGGPLWLRHMRPAMDGGCVPDVGVGRRDVEIAPDEQGATSRTRLTDPARQPLEPGQLAVADRRVKDRSAARSKAASAG